MLGDDAVLEPEDVNNVEPQQVTARLLAQPFPACVRTRGGAVGHDYVTLGDHPLQRISEVRHGLEDRLEELHEAGPTLRTVGIVLDVVVLHVAAEPAQVVDEDHVQARVEVLAERLGR